MTVIYHRFGVSIIALLLASCGGEETAGTPDVAVVPVTTTSVASPPATTPAPSQGPAPAPLPPPVTAPTPPTPTPPPAPTPPPTPLAVEPYTLGSLTYTLGDGTPPDRAVAIREAMDFAIAHTNAIANFSGNIFVVFGAGTPTADASYRGQIRFGGLIGRRVALHELAHWLGSGSTSQWAGLTGNGRFNGALASARIRAFDGSGAVVNADGMHFWPYGLNYDREFTETQRNTQMVSAQVADMRIGGDATAAIAGTRRFQNRSSTHILQGGSNGNAPRQNPNTAGTAQEWRVTFADGFVTLVSVDTGLALTSLGNAGNDVATGMAAVADDAVQQWEMLPVGDQGWFLLRNRMTGNCLDNIGVLTAGAAVRLWGCGFHPNQQWRLVR